MRRNRRARPTLNAWLFGLGVPVIALFALFSLLPYSAIMARWPLGLGEREKHDFQKLFDQRPSTDPDTVKSEVFHFTALSGEQGACPIGKAEDASGSFRFVAEGFSDTVRISNSADNLSVITTPDGHLFRGQQQLLVRPAHVADIACKYAEVIAAALELPCPAVSFASVQACGKDIGLFVVQGALENTYLRRNHMGDRSLVHLPFNAESPDAARIEGASAAELNEAVRHRLRATVGDSSMDDLGRTMDVQAFVAQVLAYYACGIRASEEAGLPMTYDASEGLFHPLFEPYRASEKGNATPVSAIGIGALIAQPEFQKLVIARADHLQSEKERLLERLALADRTWLPMLAHGVPLGMIQAEADRIKEAMLGRLWKPELEASFGQVHALPKGASANENGTAPGTLDTWLDQFRQAGDTLRFTRGKYTIDHDIVVPAGFSVVLEKGTRWLIAPGKSVIMHGTFITRGTDLNPVFIRPLEPGSPFGAVAVLGTGKTACSLRGMLMSEGSGAWNDGVHFEGMLSVHRAELRMENCEIAEGTVSVVHGQVSMMNCKYSAADKSMVTVAYGKAEVSNCSFSSPTGWDSTRTRTHTAAITLQAGMLTARSSRFADLPGTAIHCSEAAQALMTDCTFQGSANALSVTDLSVVHVDGCTFTGNGLVFDIKRADPVFGGGYLTLYSNIFEGNHAQRDLDAASSIVNKDRIGDDIWKAFGRKPETAAPAQASGGRRPHRRSR